MVPAEQPEPIKEKAASGALRKMPYGRKTAGVMKQILYCRWYINHYATMPRPCTTNASNYYCNMTYRRSTMQGRFSRSATPRSKENKGNHVGTSQKASKGKGKQRGFSMIQMLHIVYKLNILNGHVPSCPKSKPLIPSLPQDINFCDQNLRNQQFPKFSGDRRRAEWVHWSRGARV